MEWLGLDHGILYGLERARTDSTTLWMTYLTYMGNWQSVLLGVILAAFLLVRSQKPQGIQAAKGLIITLVLCFGCTELTKRAVARERPDIVTTAGEFKKPDSASFPSGHASCSMGLATGLLLAMRRIGTPSSWWLLASLPLIGYGLVIGITRLYLGVHWPTDVVAGWCLGAACAATAFFLTEKRLAIP